MLKTRCLNYAFVGDIVRTARLLPVGNFMSFPSEIIRTTSNIARQTVSELKHSKPTIGSNITPYVIDKATRQLVKNE